MIAQTRTILIQELNQLKIDLDRSNKFKDEATELKFTVTEDRRGVIKLFATNGNAYKLLLEKQAEHRWQNASSIQFENLAKWFTDLLRYETNHLKIQVTVQFKVISLYRY